MAQSHGSKVDNHYDRQAAEGEWYLKSLLTISSLGEKVFMMKKLLLNSIIYIKGGEENVGHDEKTLGRGERPGYD